MNNLIHALGFALILSACTQESKSTAPTVASCKITDKGNGNSLLECADGSSFNLADGQGKSGCSVAPNPTNPKEKTVTCTDGTSVTIQDGKDGTSCALTQTEAGASIRCGDQPAVELKNGADGRSCQASPKADASGLLIRCGDTPEIELKNGKSGDSCSVMAEANGVAITCGDKPAVKLMNGINGKNGDSCSVQSEENGVAITCGDKPAVKLLNGTNGKNGDSCSVQSEENGVAITCGDRPAVKIMNGTNGKNGDGCSVQSEESGVAISCGSNAPVKVLNGINGKNGDSCSVTPNPTGAVIQCGANPPVNLSNGQNGSSCSTTSTTEGVKITCGSSEAIIKNGPPGPVGQSCTITEDIQLKKLVFTCSNGSKAEISVIDGQIVATVPSVKPFTFDPEELTPQDLSKSFLKSFTDRPLSATTQAVGQSVWLVLKHDIQNVGNHISVSQDGGRTYSNWFVTTPMGNFFWMQDGQVYFTSPGDTCAYSLISDFPSSLVPKVLATYGKNEKCFGSAIRAVKVTQTYTVIQLQNDHLLLLRSGMQEWEDLGERRLGGNLQAGEINGKLYVGGYTLYRLTESKTLEEMTNTTFGTLTVMDGFLFTSTFRDGTFRTEIEGQTIKKGTYLASDSNLHGIWKNKLILSRYLSSASDTYTLLDLSTGEKESFQSANLTIAGNQLVGHYEGKTIIQRLNPETGKVLHEKKDSLWDLMSPLNFGYTLEGKTVKDLELQTTSTSDATLVLSQDTVREGRKLPVIEGYTTIIRDRQDFVVGQSNGVSRPRKAIRFKEGEEAMEVDALCEYFVNAIEYAYMACRANAPLYEGIKFFRINKQLQGYKELVLPSSVTMEYYQSPKIIAKGQVLALVTRSDILISKDAGVTFVRRAFPELSPYLEFEIDTDGDNFIVYNSSIAVVSRNGGVTWDFISMPVNQKLENLKIRGGYLFLNFGTYAFPFISKDFGRSWSVKRNFFGYGQPYFLDDQLLCVHGLSCAVLD